MKKLKTITWHESHSLAATLNRRYGTGVAIEMYVAYVNIESKKTLTIYMFMQMALNSHVVTEKMVNIIFSNKNLSLLKYKWYVNRCLHTV